MMKTIRSAALLAALCLPAFAPAPSRAQPASDAISAPIAALDAGLVAAMKAGKTTSFDQRYQRLAPVVTNAFDLGAVLRTAVGLRWDAIPADQQQQLLASFTRFTVASYVANFNSDGGTRIELAGTRTQGSDQIVQTRIVGGDGKATPINYVMRQEGTGWRAVDVLLDGTISRAAVLRSDFRSLLSSGGAPSLIANLDRKYRDLAAGNAG